MINAFNLRVVSSCFGNLRVRNCCVALVFQLLFSLGFCLVFNISALADGFPEDMSSGPTDSAKSGSATAASSGDSAAPAVKEYTGPKLAEFDLARYQYCGADSDCVVALNGCCGCEDGGQEVAINKDRLEAFRANFSCDNVACGQKLSSTRCFGGVVSCIEHRCRYIAEEEGI